MANNLKFYGEIQEVLPKQTGVSKSGKQWWSQSIIVEEEDAQYPSVACFTLMGKALNPDNVSQMYRGNKVTVSFNISMREWTNKEGKRQFSTELQAWRIEQGDTTAATPRRDDSGDFTPVFAPSTSNSATEQEKAPQNEQNSLLGEQSTDLPF